MPRHCSRSRELDPPVGVEGVAHQLPERKPEAVGVYDARWRDTEEAAAWKVELAVTGDGVELTAIQRADDVGVIDVEHLRGRCELHAGGWT